MFSPFWANGDGEHIRLEVHQFGVQARAALLQCTVAHAGVLQLATF